MNPVRNREKGSEQLSSLIKQASLIVLWVTALLILLKEIGVEVGPVLANAGIVGLAVGFGARNNGLDFLFHFFFILKNPGTGWNAPYQRYGGLVEKVNFPTIVFATCSGLYMFFQMARSPTMSNLTKSLTAYLFDIGVAYKEHTDRVIDVMHSVS